ncbi:putative reverse transcriptase domain-containing protein [Tanacetum coccineum]
MGTPTQGRRPREGNDERVDDLNGQGNDQGLGANRIVEGVNGNVEEVNRGAPDFSMITAQQLQNLLSAVLARVGKQENVENKNGNVVNENVQENVGNVLANRNRVGCSYKEFLACSPKEYNGKLQEVQFLGNVINGDGIHVDPRYYRRFIENFSKIAKSLTILTQKCKTFDWGEEQELAFQTLKDKFCNAPVLALLDGLEDFVVYCDASGLGLGCVLMQRALYYMDRIWVPLRGDVRTLIMDEAHKSKYFVHPGTDKIYYDLRDMYWWPGMKKDIDVYVSKCLTCLKIKAEHQRPSSLLQQLEIPEWKSERIAMDFVTKLPRTSNRHDTI